MRIATWNLNGARARLDILLRWLDVRNPDVVALQKICVPEEEFPKDTLESAGYYAEAHCFSKSPLDRADRSVAILSRMKPQWVDWNSLPCTLPLAIKKTFNPSSTGSKA